MTALLSAFLPLAMMVMMLALGLRLRPGQIWAAWRAPRALIAGLGLQLVVLPVLALGIGWALALPAPLRAGMVLLAAAPGGVSSNYISHLARGVVALSVSMTLISSLAAPLSLPVVLALAGVEVPAGAAGLWRISLGMSAVALLPMALGMLARQRAPNWAARAGRLLDQLAKAMFALMVLATFAQNWAAMRAGFAQAGAAVSLLALCAPISALVTGRALRLGPAAARTILLETSLQNVAITLFVAGPLLGRPDLAIPGLIYAVEMNIVALAVILWARRGAPGRAGAEDSDLEEAGIGGQARPAARPRPAVARRIR